MAATALQPLDSVEVYLVRHGQTAWNVERRFLGRTDIPLDAVGRAQAASVGAALRGVGFAALFTSPLTRARETAGAIGDPVLVAGLAEMDMGELEGLSAAECQARWPTLLPRWRDTPAEVHIPGGETLAEVQARVLAAFHTTLAPFPPGTRVGMVTHQLALASLLCALAARPLAEFRSFGHRNGAYARVRVAPGRAEIVAVDQGDHLTG